MARMVRRCQRWPAPLRVWLLCLATAAIILWVPSWKLGLAVFSWVAFFAFVGLLDPILKWRLRRQRERQPVVSA